MYEKEIEDLQLTLDTGGFPERETLHTAIALMRAAEPKDTEEEREHCADIAEAAPCCEVEPCVVKTFETTLLRERAAARLSGVLDGRQQGRDVRKQLEDEIAELRGRLDKVRAILTAALYR